MRLIRCSNQIKECAGLPLAGFWRRRWAAQVQVLVERSRFQVQVHVQSRSLSWFSATAGAGAINSPCMFRKTPSSHDEACGGHLFPTLLVVQPLSQWGTLETCCSFTYIGSVQSPVSHLLSPLSRKPLLQLQAVRQCTLQGSVPSSPVQPRDRGESTTSPHLPTAMLTLCIMSC